MVTIPIDKCDLYASKHFKNTWMRKWGWDYHDLRDAIRDAYKVEKMGKAKYELYVRKKGGKKLILVFDKDDMNVFVITGSEGKI